MKHNIYIRRENEAKWKALKTQGGQAEWVNRQLAKADITIKPVLADNSLRKLLEG